LHSFTDFKSASKITQKLFLLLRTIMVPPRKEFYPEKFGLQKKVANATLSHYFYTGLNQGNNNSLVKMVLTGDKHVCHFSRAEKTQEYLILLAPTQAELVDALSGKLHHIHQRILNIIAGIEASHSGDVGIVLGMVID
jgi:hypothetical protein